MKENWVIDVLSDLRSFAHQNALPQLAEHLDDARLIAAAEIAAKDDRPAEITRDNATLEAGNFLGDTGKSDIA